MNSYMVGSTNFRKVNAISAWEETKEVLFYENHCFDPYRQIGRDPLWKKEDLREMEIVSTESRTLNEVMGICGRKFRVLPVRFWNRKDDCWSSAQVFIFIDPKTRKVAYTSAQFEGIERCENGDCILHTSSCEIRMKDCSA